MSQPALPAGFRLLQLAEVASTNDVLRARALAGEPAGLVVIAEVQTAGRGRYGRSWSSPAGNLYASVLLRPDRRPAEIAQLSLVAGIALLEALAERAPAGCKPRLKWPNDLLIDGAKVAGVLLESDAGPGERGFVIIGTGVNITSAPADTPYPATCLIEQGFAPLAPADLLAGYLQRLVGWLDRWRIQGFAEIRRAWRRHGLGLGGAVRLRLEGEEVSGRFVDLSESGALLLELAGGGRREISAGEVFHIGA